MICPVVKLSSISHLMHLEISVVFPIVSSGVSFIMFCTSSSWYSSWYSFIFRSVHLYQSVVNLVGVIFTNGMSFLLQSSFWLDLLPSSHGMITLCLRMEWNLLLILLRLSFWRCYEFCSSFLESREWRNMFLELCLLYILRLDRVTIWILLLDASVQSSTTS